MRRNICNITNEMSEMDARQRREAGKVNTLEFNLRECYSLILRYCVETGTHATPRKNSYTMENGCLFINGEAVGRVAPLIHKPVYASPAADYWEGRILARQEASYDA